MDSMDIFKKFSLVKAKRTNQTPDHRHVDNKALKKCSSVKKNKTKNNNNNKKENSAQEQGQTHDAEKKDRMGLGKKLLGIFCHYHVQCISRNVR